MMKLMINSKYQNIQISIQDLEFFLNILMLHFLRIM